MSDDTSSQVRVSHLYDELLYYVVGSSPTQIRINGGWCLQNTEIISKIFQTNVISHVSTALASLFWFEMCLCRSARIQTWNSTSWLSILKWSATKV